MLPAPVTTFSVITGVGCWLAQLGSFAMSIGFIFGGVPVKVTVAADRCRRAAPARASAPGRGGGQRNQGE